MLKRTRELPAHGGLCRTQCGCPEAFRILPVPGPQAPNGFRSPPGLRGVEPPRFVVGFVHDCRRFDGMFIQVQLAMQALNGTSAHVEVYTCVDPSLREQYPSLGTMVPGHRVPFGGDLERGVNRLLPVFAHGFATSGPTSSTCGASRWRQSSGTIRTRS